jgi:hypothetical protein
LSDGRVDQTGNQVTGHLGARDVNAVTGTQYRADAIHVHEAPARAETALQRLFKRLRSEAVADATLNTFIEQLEIYTRVVHIEEVVGLEGKFKHAGRLDQLEMAMRLKEITFAEIRRNIFSRTFQTIYATLMAKIYESFDCWVRPAVIEGSSRREIDQLITQHVVLPIVEELESCPEYEGVAIQTVRGMLYFLTGNCHLVWH